MTTAYVYKLTGPQSLACEEEPLATVEKDLVQAATLYSAISPGTEVAAYNGAPPLRPMKVYPRLIGYCNVARVMEVGAEVGRFKVGDLVYSQQSHRSQFVCKESQLMGLPEACDPVGMSTAYLYHLGYSALLKGQYRPGERVAVIGLGTLGVTSVAMAALCGAEVIAFSNQISSAQSARSAGAVAVYGKSDEATLAEHNQYDLVILTSSSWQDYLLALRIVAVGGRVCMLGFPGREEGVPSFNPLDSQYIYDKQLTLLACGYTPDLDVSPLDVRFTLSRNMNFLFRNIQSGRLDPGIIVSRVAPWQDLDAVYFLLSSREPGFLTAVLQWGE